jgi:hypothetical protein
MPARGQQTAIRVAAQEFRDHVSVTIAPTMGARRPHHHEHIAENLAKLLMLVTARGPRIGYDKTVPSARLRSRRTVP